MTTPEDPYEAMPSMPPMPPMSPDQGDAEAQPGVIPLRPLALGDVYRATKDVIVRNWALLLGIAAVVAVVDQLLGLLVSLGFQRDLNELLVDRSFSSGDFVRTVVSAGAATLIVVVIGFVLGVVVDAAGILVVRAEVAGVRVDPKATVSAGIAKLGRLIGMTLLLAALAFAGFAVVFAAMFGIGQTGVLLVFAWFAVCVYFGVLFAFAGSAIVLEDATVTGSLRRSKDLVTDGWWRVFGILLLTEVIFAVVRRIVGLIVRLDWLAGMLVGIVSTPAIVCVLTLLYFDYRIRKEGPRSVLTEPRTP